MSNLVFHTPVFIADQILQFAVLLVHFCKQIDDTHVKIDQAVIRHIISARWIIGPCKRTRITRQEESYTACFLIIADEIEDIEILFASGLAETTPELLQEHDWRFRRTQEHNHVDGSDIYSLVEHVHGENHADFSCFQLLNGDISLFGELTVCIAVDCGGWNSALRKLTRHLLRMRTGTAETKRPL